MITDLIYRCPHCGAFDWLGQDGACIRCATAFELRSRTQVSVDGRVMSVGECYDLVKAFPLPDLGEDPILSSRTVRLSCECVKGRFRGFAGINAIHYGRQRVDQGRLFLYRDRLEFRGLSGTVRLAMAAVVSLTIESDTLIVTCRDDTPLFFDFLEESGKKWEDCIRLVLAGGSPEPILEFCPRVRREGTYLKASGKAKGHSRLAVPVHRRRQRDFSLFFACLRPLLRFLIKRVVPITMEGRENIPAKGPAIILPNHCSFLDSIIFAVFAPRNVWFMAKNSQYKNRLYDWALSRARSFPVRRYATDVSAVRNAIRVVQTGHVLGIFPEGERCWDNRRLPYKLGTIRLLLALGMPVIPVGISGGYALMPRWTKAIERGPLTIRVGAPLDLGHIPIPAQRLADVRQAVATLKQAMEKLLEEAP